VLVISIFGSMILLMFLLLPREVSTATRLVLPLMAAVSLELSVVLHAEPVGYLMLAVPRR
jgi:hypothetical protein